MAIDRNAVAARLEVIADALSLPDEDWLALAQDDERIIDFAARHGQSLDWIFQGDVRNLIRRCAQ